jgi:acetylglutamate/LysW-gamma-L-alpha-aminoadipate kinase
MAEALGVKEIVSLFEAPGMLEDHKDPSTLISKIQKSEIEDYLKYADGRMKKKILGVKEAMGRGVQKIYFGDARVEHPVLGALEGKGTVIE